MRPITLRPAAELAADKPHGTRIKYLGGCRCLPCRASNAAYERERAARRRSGIIGTLIPSDTARLHLLHLSSKNVGRGSVSKASDLSHLLLSSIKSGKQKQVRKSTERKILSIDEGAIGDHGLVSSTETYRQISVLCSEGFTKSVLARRIGVSANVLTRKKPKIRAITAARVERFYRLIMKGA